MILVWVAHLLYIWRAWILRIKMLRKVVAEMRPACPGLKNTGLPTLTSLSLMSPFSIHVLSFSHSQNIHSRGQSTQFTLLWSSRDR